MQSYDFDQSIGYWLAVSTNALQRVLAERLAPFGITFRQMQVIAWLARDKRLTQSQLAERMLVEPPTLVGILSRMESCGWITRTQCHQDRRKNWIESTDKVVPIWNQITQRMMEVRQEATAGLTADEQTELIRLLGHVHANLRSKRAETCESEEALSAR